jgi:hypothetical protein
MAYEQDTILNVNAANVLALELDALLIEAGWTVVEELIPSTTFHSKIYKSDGTLNQCGYDWFVCIRWNAVGTESYFEIIPMGAYDSGTKIGSQIACTMSGTGSTAGSASEYNEPVTGAHCGSLTMNSATSATSTWSSHGTSINKDWFYAIIPSSAFGFWSSITLDHVYLATTIAPALGYTNVAFVAFTVDLTAEWIANPIAAQNPIAMASRGLGVSVSIIGTGTTDNDHRDATVDGLTQTYGVELPALTSDILPAYAWRPTLFWSGIDYDALEPIVSVGGGSRQFVIGEAIDLYFVREGSIGDTVTIDAATYVLSGNFNTSMTGPSAAVLVEA